MDVNRNSESRGVCTPGDVGTPPASLGVCTPGDVGTPPASLPVSAELPAQLFDSQFGVVTGYRQLVAHPRSVCRDWFYWFTEVMPGHPVLWAVLLGLMFPYITHTVEIQAAPTNFIRSATDLRAAYFLLPTLLVQTLAMPVFYQAVLTCFDEMRHLMTGTAAEVSDNRRALIEPSRAFQWKLLGAAFLIALVSEEVSGARFTRAVSGDWNDLDLWLVFANSMTLMVFVWFVVMPISRTLLLAQHIEKMVEPRLFDDSVGAPIAAFGLRAGLVFAIPYIAVNGVGVIMLSDAWSYLLPGFIGSVMAISFALIPGARLRRRIRRVKHAELARANAAIERNRRAAGAEELASEQTRELMQLLQYRREVKLLNEWPFDAALIRWFSLYFLLVPLTWVASALVEMLVERLAG